MNCTVVDFAKDRTVFNITGITKEELDNKLNLFTSQRLSRINSVRSPTNGREGC